MAVTISAIALRWCMGNFKWFWPNLTLLIHRLWTIGVFTDSLFRISLSDYFVLIFRTTYICYNNWVFRSTKEKERTIQNGCMFCLIGIQENWFSLPTEACWRPILLCKLYYLFENSLQLEHARFGIIVLLFTLLKSSHILKMFRKAIPRF